MSLDFSSLENDLQQLRPAAIDASLLERLEACTVQTWTAPRPGEIQLEQQLQAIAPAKLPPALMVALESTVHDAPFPGADNLVPFTRPASHPARHHRAWWAAAAVVALTGALSALLVPTRHPSGPLAAAAPLAPVPRPATAPATGGFIPAGFKRGLTEARDEGFIWQSNDEPRRVLKVVYLDRVTLKDAAGRTYQVDQPRVEYILVPAKTD